MLGCTEKHTSNILLVVIKYIYKKPPKRIIPTKKWFRQTLSLKFSSSPNRLNRPAPAVGLKQNGFMITVCKRSRTFPYRENK